TKASYFEGARFVRGEGAPHPASQFIEHLGILIVANDDLSVHPKSSNNEPVFPIAVSRLVQVHEIHVDLTPGQFTVELGVEMRERLLQTCEPRYPHLCG